MNNSLHFYNHPQDQHSPVARLRLDGQNTAYHVQTFLTGDIQTESSCSEWINRIIEAKGRSNYFYEVFVNCCTITLSHTQINIKNKYLDLNSPPKAILLDDIKVILEKWLEYLRTSQDVKYSWQSANFVFN
jgi:hypothetical protein